MTGSEKRKALILLALVMIITFIIAASLSQLDLQPGMPLPKVEHSQVVLAPSEEEPFVAISVNKFAKVLFAIILTVLTLYVIYKLLEGTNWKNLRKFITIIAVITLITGSSLFLLLLLPKSQNFVSMELPTPIAISLATSPLGSVPPMLLWLVGICLLVSSILLGVWVIFHKSNRAMTINMIGLEAEKAWQALKIGLDLKDVIVQCYRQMSLALEKEHGLERENSMTTREFENLLEAAGIPHEPIHQLTQLFEAVRYGNWQPNLIDKQEAIHCLEAIMLHSREMKEMD